MANITDILSQYFGVQSPLGQAGMQPMPLANQQPPQMNFTPGQNHLTLPRQQPFFTNPADQAAIQQQGLVPAMFTRAGEQGMESARAFGRGFQNDPVVNALGDSFKYLFMGQGPPGFQDVASGGSSTARPNFENVQSGSSFAEQDGLGGGGGGVGSSYQGQPLPQAPSLQTPQVDIGRMFDPIMEQLKDPERVKGPSKIEGLAQVLGGAAKGALAGQSNRYGGGTVGATLAGAGAGSADALTELRHEEQALEVEHQRAVRQMEMARAGVLSNKAGAEIDLARDVSNTKNAEAQLKFNRDVQASMLSRQEVTPLGNGYARVEQFNPETGKATVTQIDTVGPMERSLQQALMMSKLFGKAEDPLAKKIVVDKQEYPIGALFGALGANMSTPVEAEAAWAAIRTLNNPVAFGEYSRRIEEYYSSTQASNAEQQVLAAEPEHTALKFMYLTFLTDPAERARANAVGGQQQVQPQQTPTSQPYFDPRLKGY